MSKKHIKKLFGSCFPTDKGLRAEYNKWKNKGYDIVAGTCTKHMLRFQKLAREYRNKNEK